MGRARGRILRAREGTARQWEVRERREAVEIDSWRDESSSRHVEAENDGDSPRDGGYSSGMVEVRGDHSSRRWVGSRHDGMVEASESGGGRCEVPRLGSKRVMSTLATHSTGYRTSATQRTAEPLNS